MARTRREFLKAGAAMVAAGGVAALAMGGPEGGPGAGGKRLRVLILGGTGFLGPACTDALLARGHAVTLFNRGVRERARKERGRPSQVPAGVEVLYGNRDPDKYADESLDSATAPAGAAKGLATLQGRSFDAVIDTSGYFPRHVRASAELLAGSVGQYVFVSTISVYADNDTPGADETAPIAAMPEGQESVEEMGPGGSYYGPLKALCERAAEGAMPGRVTNIRPGFIVGARDTSARFVYWPWRAARGSEMLAPGEPSDPVQFIDARDLADFIVRCVERGTVGVFNATGPAGGLAMGAFIEGVAAGVAGLGVQKDGAERAGLVPVWVDAEFLRSQGVGLGEIPIWMPPIGDVAGFHRRKVDKAIGAGLTFRPVAETARWTLEWWRTLPPELAARQLPSGFTPEREGALLAAWKQRGAGQRTGEP